GPRYVLLAVNLAVILAASAEFLVARQLRAHYVRALEGGLVRHGEELEDAARLSLSDFTAVGSLAGLDRTAVLRAVGAARSEGVTPEDPVVPAIADLRWGDRVRVHAALRRPPPDPLLIGALIPLLAHRDTMRPAADALTAYGTRAAGQLVDALLDP